MPTGKTYFFNAGLPRSGSTLLSVLLDQNPLIHAGPASPVWQLVGATDRILSGQDAVANPKPDVFDSVVAATIDTFYSDRSEPVVVDKSWNWLTHINLIERYITVVPKILCTVRDPLEILASFIDILDRSPTTSLIDEAIIKSGRAPNLQTRCKALTGPGGPVRVAFDALEKVLRDGQRDRIHFIDYSDLAEEPERTMNDVYEFLEIDSFSHDFDNIINRHPSRDVEAFGVMGLHDVRRVITTRQRDCERVLPKNTVDEWKGVRPWVEPASDTRKKVDSRSLIGSR